ncbi:MULTISPECIES: hypothetical protein [unclassified Mesorhizobium]|uniref:hypothetical protein n=1 Tax=unclassified Mesorhizobium TaxID=325217 RepID=UPI000BB099EB|nr:MULTISPECIES: hypothetical protein [unclassified Mesorhizobium]TGT63593.1 hypothetical protein EN813_009425 [Mesorhizobium sp. M00.F.Ca.ET.170.01.1.1]AZO11321.1 hypothetical protein EJ074_21150 [Mesorhizobium sp. M3A.F.Ca.ET.080.04.2.1]PBB88430.1 hypothetical protein CK216_01460 [Mesorhizobium sp. WSM3876]RWB76639.1 MAG: hypothetical protein EOQ49_02165 [Mesorhizobium sp.]RWB92183.1 MAG: hypothetical protein EOQ52_01365 [Mesorhizobium sp.]
MADDRTARPVSGEIMTGTAADAVLERAMFDAPADIVDADYVVLPRFTGRSEPVASPPLPATPSIEGMDMLRKPEIAPARAASRGGPIFWIAGVGMALAAFWVSGGHALVRQSPFWASPQPASALTISGVTSRIDDSGSRPVLFVDGEAANDGMQAASLPPLEIRVTGNDSSITRYRLGTSDRSLAPGERFGFSSRLDVPRNGVRAVSVTFAG